MNSRAADHMSIDLIKGIWDSLSLQRKKRLALLQAIGILSAVSEICNMYILFPFLEILANDSEGRSLLFLDLLPYSRQSKLAVLGALFVIAILISTLLRVVGIRLQIRLAAQIAADLGEKVLRAAIHRPLTWHLNNNSSLVLGYLTKDVDITNLSIQETLLLVVNGSVVVSISAALLYLSPTVMIAASAVYLIYYWFIFTQTRGKLKQNGLRMTQAYQASVKIAQEALGGIKDIILGKSGEIFVVKYKEDIMEYRLAHADININAQVPKYLIEGFTLILIIGLAFCFGQAKNEYVAEKIPIAGALALGAYRLLQPLQNCFAGISSIHAHRSSIQKILPFLKQDTSSLLQEKMYSRYTTAECDVMVAFRDVSFKYQDASEYTIENFNLTVRTGEKVALVGQTGSGKSTIADLALGLLQPTSGTIAVESSGHVQKNQKLLDNWQKAVAYVPQTIYLTDSSFAENVAFGISKDEIDMQKVQDACIKARIHALITSSKDGYNTLVGERGFRLSGGQRQRIGLARAFYKEARLVVLDEATSALDNKTEVEVITAINNLEEEITIIAIAHRLSTVKDFDRIVVIDQGRIVGTGNYNDLKDNNRYFKNLLSVRSKSSVTCESIDF
ncbi:ABC transporter ATP-binding protein [Synechococcus sp. W4D4]|uniref:ABC transporter ATP-binding protein n=1 Tax=Synechococcus sp. W4D4 TaxID=3392294 RepID=UPI0039EC92DC